MNLLITYTIYERPLDYPQGFVVREFAMVDGAPVAGQGHYADDLETAREIVHALHPGAYCLGREPEDEPQIVETWI